MAQKYYILTRYQFLHLDFRGQRISLEFCEEHCNDIAMHKRCVKSYSVNHIEW